MHMELFTYHGNPVRVGAYDGEPWFVGVDIAAVLGFADPKLAVAKYVEPEEQIPMMFHCEEHDHDFRLDLISYIGAQDLLFNADGKEAPLFKSWLADVATVVRHGGFEEEEE